MAILLGTEERKKKKKKLSLRSGARREKEAASFAHPLKLGPGKTEGERKASLSPLVENREKTGNGGGHHSRRGEIGSNVYLHLQKRKATPHCCEKRKKKRKEETKISHPKK